MDNALAADPEALNDGAIGDLAHETGEPIDRVRKVYEQEFARLAATARIPDFLVVLAMKHTRERVRRRAKSGEALVG